MYGTSNATELGESQSEYGPTCNNLRPATASPSWLFPVMIWRDRAGK